MLLYHGTTATAAAKILTVGLVNAHLSGDYDLACYYADCSAEESDGEPVVLEIEIAQDDEALLPDLIALTEPVSFAGLTSDELLERIAAHPEPPAGMSWRDSLQLVSSVVYEGLLAPARLRRVTAA